MRPARREEELVRVRDRDVVAADRACGRLAGDAEGCRSLLRLVVALARRSLPARRRRERRPGPDDRAAAVGLVCQGEPAARERRQAHGRHRQPGLSALVRAAARRRARSGRSTTRRRGKGFESAVAYAVAKQLGFARGQVKWTYVPFNRSFAPGLEAVRLRHQPDLVSRLRARRSSPSATSYYDVNQALVVLKGTPIAKVHSVAGLKPYKLGAQLGTTSYDYIKDTIKPSQSPAVFPQNAAAVQALKNRQIDGLVVDLPTAFYVTAVQVPNSTILGQFPAEPRRRALRHGVREGQPARRAASTRRSRS